MGILQKVIKRDSVLLTMSQIWKKTLKTGFKIMKDLKTRKLNFWDGLLSIKYINIRN